MHGQQPAAMHAWLRRPAQTNRRQHSPQIQSQPQSQGLPASVVGLPCRVDASLCGREGACVPAPARVHTSRVTPCVCVCAHACVCRPSWGLGGVVGVIVTGLALLVEGETDFDPLGFSLVMTASCLSGLRFTLTQVLLHGHGHTNTGGWGRVPPAEGGDGHTARPRRAQHAGMRRQAAALAARPILPRRCCTTTTTMVLNVPRCQCVSEWVVTAIAAMAAPVPLPTLLLIDPSWPQLRWAVRWRCWRC